MRKNQISAVVLAAGYSSRMGAFKPLLDLDGTPALRYLTESILRSGIRHITIVTGHRSEELPPALEPLREGVLMTGVGQDAADIRFAHNPDFAEGMFTSIQTGIRAALADSKPDGILIFPVDVPLVPCNTIQKLIAESEKHPDAFAVPCFLGKKGHPLHVPAVYFQDILSHDGTHGLKGVTEKSDTNFHYVESGTEAVVMDMDTPEGYREILSFLKGKTGFSEINQLLPGRRIILVRHGSTRKHRGKIFLGQTDVPLSEKGRMEATDAAAELEKLATDTRRIYSSDLIRARETAEIIAGGRQITLLPELREMHLGDWDGKYIDEIRAAFPEEYEKRGKDILRYKRGNKGENFYDLRYRALRGLRKIEQIEEQMNSENMTQFETKADRMDAKCNMRIGMKEERMDEKNKTPIEMKKDREPSKDVIIVSHLGVIRALCSLLTGCSDEEVWTREFPRGSVTVFGREETPEY